MAVLANAQQWGWLMDYTVPLAGIALLATWLLRTSLGRTALAGSKPRRNWMPFFMPVIALYFWFVGAQLLQLAMQQITGRVNAQQQVIVDTIAYSLAAGGVIVLVLLLAHFYFARGIKGFGLWPRRIPKDLAGAALRLLAVWPLVLAVLAVVQFVGRLEHGQSYQIPEHQTLKELTQAPSAALKALLVLAAVVVAPVQEEMLFRGLVQTILRSYINRPWLAIATTSALFALVHADQSHWPALFVLAMGLGYSYEKSGSLWQPIFMHAFFNGTVILLALFG